MFSVKDLTKKFGVGEATVLRWILSGQLKAMNVGRMPGLGKPRWRITEKALADFESARSTTVPARPTVRRTKRKSPEVIEFYK